MTEKTEAYMDNLQVGLELWEKQLMLGEEVDAWAVAKLGLFAESHPFHDQQHVADMKVRFPWRSFFTGSLSLQGSSSTDPCSLLCRMRFAPMRRTLSISTRSLWRSKRCCRVRRPCWSCR